MQERRGELLDQMNIDNTRIMMMVKFPLNEILVDFFDDLKSVTSGYARYKIYKVLLHHILITKLTYYY